jgi:2Fe-2S ferredoxin
MKIFLTDLEGTTHAIDAIEGWRVMEIIRDHGFPMKAECGGACACATCHVYVDEEWIGQGCAAQQRRGLHAGRGV